MRMFLAARSCGYGTSALRHATDPAASRGRPWEGASGCPATKRFTECAPPNFVQAAARRAETLTITHTSHQTSDIPHARYEVREPNLDSKSNDTHESTIGSPTKPTQSHKTPRAEQKMAYTKDYYSILGLNVQSHGPSKQIPTADLRRAYKLALLSAHPDKTSTQQSQPHTVDDVKEAYTTLSSPASKASYDNYILQNPGILISNATTNLQPPSSDFILGLEVLDLSDFDVLDPGFKFSSNDDNTNSNSNDGDDGDEIERNGQMEWTRSCRCGMEKGYVILEEELEDAEQRGEGEVLVGCEGCSLWVRVGFGVEDLDD
jgi:diphthamide biosynthesis protein 4